MPARTEDFFSTTSLCSSAIPASSRALFCSSFCCNCWLCPGVPCSLPPDRAAEAGVGRKREEEEEEGGLTRRSLSSGGDGSIVGIVGVDAEGGTEAAGSGASLIGDGCLGLGESVALVRLDGIGLGRGRWVNTTASSHNMAEGDKCRCIMLPSRYHPSFVHRTETAEPSLSCHPLEIPSPPGHIYAVEQVRGSRNPRQSRCWHGAKTLLPPAPLSEASPHMPQQACRCIYAPASPSLPPILAPQRRRAFSWQWQNGRAGGMPRGGAGEGAHPAGGRALDHVLLVGCEGRRCCGLDGRREVRDALVVALPCGEI